jgi:DHA1 family tetracycline resistance protein-like MFS transporter
MSVASIAGVASPLFFGWIYSISAGEGARVPHPGLAFFLAAGVLGLAALIGWWVGRQANKTEAADAAEGV